jgi:hypothetical protein
MSRCTVIFGLLVTGMLMTGCQPAMELQSHSPRASDPLWKAAKQVLSIDCGVSTFDPGYQEHYQMIREAGPSIVPILTAMVVDKELSVWFVHNAARHVMAYPFSPEFRQALRARRDDPDFRDDHGARLGVFDYFAELGDDSDLDWMLGAVESLDESRRPSADKPISELRCRLGR